MTFQTIWNLCGARTRSTRFSVSGYSSESTWISLRNVRKFAGRAKLMGSPSRSITIVNRWIGRPSCEAHSSSCCRRRSMQRTSRHTIWSTLRDKRLGQSIAPNRSHTTGSPSWSVPATTGTRQWQVSFPSGGVTFSLTLLRPSATERDIHSARSSMAERSICSARTTCQRCARRKRQAATMSAKRQAPSRRSAVDRNKSLTFSASPSWMSKPVKPPRSYRSFSAEEASTRDSLSYGLHEVRTARRPLARSAQEVASTRKATSAKGNHDCN
mmetsp:Transcript_107433/g.302312  ORF Transcript_107433/g.302312 Transcript_107433/m.302312 type:complete len:270 (-) Transcript_107433:130-939(-)